MGLEIEKKFLVVSDAWKQQASRCVQYRQGYLCGNERTSIRIRISDASAHLNIKSATLGVRRQEYEYAIPAEDARELLDTLCIHPLIEKTRHFVPHGDHVWEVDVFEGDNAGLVVAEVELRHIDDSPSLPPWVGDEVSHDVRYYNTSLVRHPYKDW
ncbi:adenylate cyclase [Ectothiorhodospira shaposhnikovii]|uniref:CYTH domain-containing protein n=1 Tax=Ectothiorhodospira shaposhnikovii TaxID=1054 RepID=UPI00190315B9|nr:CYTH domain-containing protein [Ectothiorhodospira shaposhnikovii]MBK1673150.1 adenylate cyclase [Ectothiorhodospira shaposhnikovii]